MPKFSDSDINAALLGRRAIGEYPFPGLGGTSVGIRCLSDEELDEIRLQAAQICKHKNVDAVLDPDFLERLIQRLTVARAFFDVEKTQERFFASHEQVAQLDNLLVRTLYELYCFHVQRRDPFAFLSAEDAQHFAETLGKSPGAEARLSMFGRDTLLSLSLSLARLLRET